MYFQYFLDNTQLKINIPGEAPIIEISPDTLEKAHTSAGAIYIDFV